MYCSHPEGLEREDVGKWAGGDPPFPICGGSGGEREPRIIIGSAVGGTVPKIKDEVDRSTRWWGSVECDGGGRRRDRDKSALPPQQ